MREKDILNSWDATVALLDAYEPLLSEAQKEILNLYFRFNLSLSEIAEERGTSRTAIFDAIKKGVAKLSHYEHCLHLARTDEQIHVAMQRLIDATSLEEAKTVLPILENIVNQD